MTTTYDFAFCTKYRFQVLQPSMSAEITRMVSAVATTFGSSVQKVNYELDFVHIQANVNANVSPVDLLASFKGSLSFGLQKEYPSVKNTYYGKAMFDRDFFAVTTGTTQGTLDAWKLLHPVG